MFQVQWSEIPLYPRLNDLMDEADSPPALRFTAPPRFVTPDAIAIATYFVCGLVNNFGYVVMLSGARDILEESGTTIGTGAILLADILPTLSIKLVAPFFMEHIPFGLRILFTSIFGTTSFLLAALDPSLAGKLSGVCFASLASGLGEITFLSLLAFFHPNTVAGWSSGTGAAGLVGSGIYLLFTSIIGLSPMVTLLTLTFVPVIPTVLYYFILLPKSDSSIVNPFSDSEVSPRDEKTRIISSGDSSESSSTKVPSQINSSSLSESQSDETSPVVSQVSDNEYSSGFRSIRLIDEDHYQPLDESSQSYSSGSGPTNWSHATFKEKLFAVRHLLIPYMIPLFVVYFAEYLINTGIAPVIVFQNSFVDEATHYRLFSFVYQAGVFVSRSSVTWFRFERLWIPSASQVVLFFIFFFHVLFFIFPSLWIMVSLTFIEGLLGGSVYVGAFYSISTNVQPRAKREFALGIVSVSDSLGITLAGVISLPLEAYLLANGHRDTTRRGIPGAGH